MNNAEIISVLSLIISFLSIGLSLWRYRPIPESYTPLLLPDGKILIREGVKITKVAQEIGGPVIVQWSKK